MDEPKMLARLSRRTAFRYVLFAAVVAFLITMTLIIQLQPQFPIVGAMQSNAAADATPPSTQKRPQVSSCARIHHTAAYRYCCRLPH